MREHHNQVQEASADIELLEEVQLFLQARCLGVSEGTLLVYSKGNWGNLSVKEGSLTSFSVDENHPPSGGVSLKHIVYRTADQSLVYACIVPRRINGKEELVASETRAVCAEDLLIFVPMLQNPALLGAGDYQPTFPSQPINHETAALEKFGRFFTKWCLSRHCRK